MDSENPIPRVPARRRYHIGGEVSPTCGSHFRVWAPGKDRISLVICDYRKRSLGEFALQKEGNGYFEGWVAEAKVDTLYGFRVDGGSEIVPDPASRFQPSGPFGPSQIIDPAHFQWSDSHWNGISREGQVIYELHFGTFTQEGTYAAAVGQLRELAELGVTVLEVMPVADFPGRFGWGYDGVCLFAPTRLYGSPDDLRRFIDQAHGHGLGVILDVVYNHLGPDGQSLQAFSDYYFSNCHETAWGNGMNFDGQESAEVRRFFLANAAYWIEEFHFDGLRFDATQDIKDSSDEHILTALARQVRTSAGNRGTLLVGENEPQQTSLVRPSSQGGFGLDALWNDDFHHSSQVAMNGHSEAYFSDYRGSPQELISAAKYGFLYQGQWYQWQKKCRGTPALDLPPTAFITFLQNHDQIANSIRGERCHVLCSPGCYRAMTALLLLAPGTPMLFQGQEFAASGPFNYFADLGPEMAALTRDGRRNFLAQFPSISSPQAQASLADPGDVNTFERCKLDFSERVSHGPIYAMHRDLLRLRREDETLGKLCGRGLDGAVLAPATFVLRYFGKMNDDRLLIVNFGADLRLSPLPEPLLAPPDEFGWQMIWSSENPVYGGSGVSQLDTKGAWAIPAHAALVMSPARRQSKDDQ